MRLSAAYNEGTKEGLRLPSDPRRLCIEEWAYIVNANKPGASTGRCYDANVCRVKVGRGAPSLSRIKTTDTPNWRISGGDSSPILLLDLFTLSADQDRRTRASEKIHAHAATSRGSMIRPVTKLGTNFRVPYAVASTCSYGGRILAAAWESCESFLVPSLENYLPL